jgi:hypothetical protein
MRTSVLDSLGLVLVPTPEQARASRANEAQASRLVSGWFIGGLLEVLAMANQYSPSSKCVVTLRS